MHSATSLQLPGSTFQLRSLVGGTENDGDAWVTKSTIAPGTAKVASIEGFIKLVASYTEAMVADAPSPSESDDDEDVEDTPITTLALWASPINANQPGRGLRVQGVESSHRGQDRHQPEHC
jgi:hypothetical protein